MIWVHEAQKDHYDFVLKMQERGVEVLDLHDLLAETLRNTEARACVLDRRVTANTVGGAVAKSCGPGSTRCRAAKLAESPDRRHRHARICPRAKVHRACWLEVHRQDQSS